MNDEAKPNWWRERDEHGRFLKMQPELVEDYPESLVTQARRHVKRLDEAAGFVERQYEPPQPKFITFTCGQIKTHVFGGPYRQKPDNMFGVCMAGEIKDPAPIRVGVRDFSVPDEIEFKAALIAAIAMMNVGAVVYAGCMGGIGRTGMFLAALKKVEIEARYSSFQLWAKRPDCIEAMRAEYKQGAVETAKQEEWLRILWVRDIAIWARGLQ